MNQQKIIQLEEGDFRDQIINKGLVQSANFSWDKCFNETVGFYQEVFNKKFI